MIKKTKKSSEKIIYGPPVCKKCGTKIFDNKNVCVMCRCQDERRKKKQ